MLVKTAVAPYRWARDAEVSDLIDYLDDHLAKFSKPTATYDENVAIARAALPSSILKAVSKEYELCRNDFAYAARNYFWIEDRNQRKDILFRLLPGQELIYETLSSMKAKGKSQRVLIIKSRQLGCSTVVEGLGAWRTIFFTNINGLIISKDPGHAAYLFRIAQKIYDRLPWWLKPRCASREYKTGLIFDNPDYQQRYDDPGMNSQILAMGANAITASAQGRRINWAHLSETADWDEIKAREIIEEDVVNALPEGPESFAVIETTAKGAGTYMHWKWNEAINLGERSEWRPLFFPSFFDRSHAEDVPDGWQPEEREQQIRETAEKAWVRCDFEPCQQFHYRKSQGVDLTGAVCPTCNKGTLKQYICSDGFLRWMETKRYNAQGDDESLKKLLQEQATTAEESFVLSGIEIFSQKAIEWAERNVEDPIAEGYLDQHLRFHGVNKKTGKCWLDGCEANHRNDDKSLRIWRFPEPGREYNIGSDVGHGIRRDSSTACVMEINRRGAADEQVAAWDRNDMDAVSFASFLNKLGNFYGQCQIAPEMNLATTANVLQVQLGYPKIYQRKSLNNAALTTSMLGWLTTGKTKPMLYHTFRKALEDRSVVLRDRKTVAELRVYRQDPDSSVKAGAAKGFHDDLIMSAMIAEFTAHDADWDEDSQTFVERIPLSLDNAPWIFQCMRGDCLLKWPASAASDYRRCPKCRNMNISAERNMSVVHIGADGESEGATAETVQALNQHLWDEYGIWSHKDTFGDSGQDYFQQGQSEEEMPLV